MTEIDINKIGFLTSIKSIRKHLSNDFIYKTNDSRLIKKYLEDNLQRFSDKEIEIMHYTLENNQKNLNHNQNNVYGTIGIIIAILTILITITITTVGILKDILELSVIIIFSIRIFYLTGALAILYIVILGIYNFRIDILRNKDNKLCNLLMLELRLRTSNK